MAWILSRKKDVTNCSLYLELGAVSLSFILLFLCAYSLYKSLLKHSSYYFLLDYPQFFFEFQDGTINFLGNFDKIDSLNETTGLSAEILAQHPEIETWDKVFNSVVESFE